jgi:hydroxymethylpyrimidine/phosphomethylpyrimidine kinase
VGGTDPTGAAGLDADMRAASSVGVFGCGVVTAVTVQTSLGVTDVVAMPASVVSAQLDAALAETEASVLKTGMLVGQDIVRAVAQSSGRKANIRLVIDPVIASSSGRSLLDEGGTKLLMEMLLPRAALVTPNVLELGLLTRVEGEGRAAMELGADHLLLLGAAAVLIKGGHASDEGDGQVHDLFRTADGDGEWISRPRREGSFRGTGCTLGAAIAARLALGTTLKDAVLGARQHLEQAMLEATPGAFSTALLGPVVLAR